MRKKKETMKQQINGKGLGKAIIFFIVFCSLWFGDTGVNSIPGALLNIVLYFLFGKLFVDSMEKTFK